MRKPISLLLTLGLMAGACHDESASHPDQAEGAVLFEKNCKRCHGIEGKGSFFKGVPPNRTTRLSKKQIADLITKGSPAFPEMPKFEKLSRGQALLIAGHVEYLKSSSDGENTFWLTSPKIQ